MTDDQMLRVKALEIALGAQRADVVNTDEVTTAAKAYYDFLVGSALASKGDGLTVKHSVEGHQVLGKCSGCGQEMVASLSAAPAPAKGDAP